jgi:cytochrome c1
MNCESCNKQCEHYLNEDGECSQMSEEEQKALNEYLVWLAENNKTENRSLE